MGLFSKPSEDKVVEMFNALSDTERESVKTKLFGDATNVEEPKTEPVNDSVDVAETTEQSVEPVAEVSGDAENKGAEENTPKETFEEMYKRLVDETKKEIESIKSDFNQKLEEIAKAKEEKTTETKPFGLSETSKQYAANARPKETSKDMINRIFGGKG